MSNHIERAIKLYSKIIEYADATWPEREVALNGSKSHVIVKDEKTNFLMHKLMYEFSKFPKPETTDVEYQVINDIFNNTNNILDTIKDIPPTILESVLPVAMLRDLMFRQGLGFDPTFQFLVKGKKVDTWSLLSPKFYWLISYGTSNHRTYSIRTADNR